MAIYFPKGFTIAPPVFVTEGLIVKLDASDLASYPGSGSVWTDISTDGTNYSGSIVNATFSSTAGGCFDLDGTGDYIQISHNSNLSFNTTTIKTMQMWVYFDTITTDGVLINKLTAAYGFDGYYLRVGAGGSLISSTNGASIAKSYTSATGVVSAGNWYLITFMGQIAATNNTTRVYVNTTNVISGFHATDTISESNNLLLGANLNRPSVSGNDSDIKIGAFYFYNRFLNEEEIRRNFELTKSRYGL